jgi:hypothetical protein
MTVCCCLSVLLAPLICISTSRPLLRFAFSAHIPTRLQVACTGGSQLTRQQLNAHWAVGSTVHGGFTAAATRPALLPFTCSSTGECGRHLYIQQLRGVAQGRGQGQRHPFRPGLTQPMLSTPTMPAAAVQHAAAQDFEGLACKPEECLSWPTVLAVILSLGASHHQGGQGWACCLRLAWTRVKTTQRAVVGGNIPGGRRSCWHGGVWGPSAQAGPAAQDGSHAGRLRRRAPASPAAVAKDAAGGRLQPGCPPPPLEHHRPPADAP